MGYEEEVCLGVEADYVQRLADALTQNRDSLLSFVNEVLKRQGVVSKRVDLVCISFIGSVSAPMRPYFP